MEHTYLRYECADSFGLATSSASSKAPPSNSTLAFLGSAKNAPLLTTAGSYCIAFNLKTCLPTLKIGHRERLSGGVGTGRALNSDEVVCLDVSLNESGAKIATGWVDGTVRVFDIYQDEINKPTGLVHSLLEENDNEDFYQREPLVLNGHNQSPVRTIAFDSENASRLASGGSDGSVVLWDIIAESGLFRLIGHRGGITDIRYVHLSTLDGLITTCLDGLVKIWDLGNQCCIQTLASHRGEVWSGACMKIKSGEDEQDRWRLLTGGSDGRVKVWRVEESMRNQLVTQKDEAGEGSEITKELTNLDDVCHFIGNLSPPPNVVTSAEKISSICYHPSGRFVGVLQANAKNVDIYSIRSVRESQKKRQRRLRRRQEKTKRKTDPSDTVSNRQKRGTLDDPESSADENNETSTVEDTVDPEAIKASDEFEYITTVRSSHKVKGFAFHPFKEKGELTRVVCSLASNSMEIHAIVRSKSTDDQNELIIAEKRASADMYGHPTGIRGVALSSDDSLAFTISKNVAKIWNVASRSVIQSLSPTVPSSKKAACYGLCGTFLPGNSHVVIGTREGHLMLIDIGAGEVVCCEENAHDGAIWAIDLRRPTPSDHTVALVTGSADKLVKFWEIETEENEDGAEIFILVHTRTLQMTDDVVATRYSHVSGSSKRMIFVSTLDCTIKVFFDDSLKLFLSLYGHKLPALAVDASDDDILLASSGADKTVKVWGLDFGDTHRTLHGHEDSVTDLQFVKRTHNFFTSSKDGTIRYWDGDRFEQILLLTGHCAEVNCLAISRTGAFVLSGGMDRQVRIWERTKDIVFLEEEKERALERAFDKVDNRDENGTAAILDKKGDIDEENDGLVEGEPQSEAAVKRSIMSIAAGDRIMEAIELADQESKEIAAFRRANGPEKSRPGNVLMFGLEPSQYVLWVLRSIKEAELEQALLILPLNHLERLLYYLILLLKAGRAVELCSRVGIFMVKTHQNQVRCDALCFCECISARTKFYPRHRTMLRR